jgi:hypothetical protein
MEHGIRTMTKQQLEDAYQEAMDMGAYAMAERLAAELTSPRRLHVPLAVVRTSIAA